MRTVPVTRGGGSQSAPSTLSSRYREVVILSQIINYLNKGTVYLVVIGISFQPTLTLAQGAVQNIQIVSVDNSTVVDSYEVAAYGGGTQPAGYQNALAVGLPRRMLVSPGERVTTSFSTSIKMLQCRSLEDALAIL